MSGITGSPAVQSVTKRTGSYALQCLVSDPAATCYVSYSVTGSPTVFVGTIYFRWNTALSTATRILRFTVASGLSGAVYFDPADNKIYPYLAAAGTKSATALAQNTWYRIDWKFDVSTGTSALDVQLDGTAITQKTFSQAATSVISLFVGMSTSATGEIYYDDMYTSLTSGDYPIGALEVVNLTPNADGTHNAGTNVIEANDGTDIGTTTAYDKINSIPPSNTTYIKQVATGTGNYFEVALSNMPSGTPLGLMGWVAYQSGGTAANEFATGVMDGSTFREIYGNPTTRADYSESSIYYKSAVISLTTLNETNVNGLTVRGGYSNDISPVPYCVDVGVEVAYQPTTGYTLTAAQASFSLTGIASGLAAARKLTADVRSLALTGQATSLLAGRKLTAAQTSFSLTGQSASFLAARKLSADVCSFALAGQDASFQRTLILSTATGSINLTGQIANLLAARKMSGDAVAFILSGQDAGLLAARKLTSEAVAFNLSGMTAGLLADRKLSADSADFLLTGYDAEFNVSSAGAYQITADTASFDFIGQDAGLLAARKLTSEAGAFNLTGLAAGLLAGRKLTADAADYVLTFYDADFNVSAPGAYQLIANTGAFLLTGNNATLLLGRIYYSGIVTAASASSAMGPTQAAFDLSVVNSIAVSTNRPALLVLADTSILDGVSAETEVTQ